MKGKLHLTVLLVNLLIDKGILLQDALHHLAATQIIRSSLQVLYALLRIVFQIVGRHSARLLIERRADTAHVQHRLQHHLRLVGTVVHRGILHIRYDHLGKPCTIGFQHLDAHLLAIVYQIARLLDGIFHIGQSAEHHSVGIGLCVVRRHLHLLLGGLTKLHIDTTLSHSHIGRAKQQNE